MNKSSYYQIPLLPILALLSFSTVIPALAFAAPLAQSDKDWQYINGNSWAWNYSPQTQINKNNVQNLEVKWVYPVGGKSLAPAGLQTLQLSEGAPTPPIVRNGIVYVGTNYLRMTAIDAKTGKQLWANDYTLNVSDVQKRLPWVPHGFISHIHGIRYWESGDAIIYTGLACDIVALEAKTGKEKLRVNDLCLNVPGSVYVYRPNGASQNVVGTYEKGKQFIFTVHGNTGSWVKQGRHVTMGIGMDTKQIIWRVFSQPPQDVLAKDWALQECDIGFFQDIPCNDVATRARQNLEWDWAQPNEPPSPYGGVAASWGQPVVDEDTGLLYVGTGNQSPYTNVSLTPGPRLYGSTIMAIDMNKGQRVWWLQPFPHDPYDYDCNWSGILTEIQGMGKIYMKGCKEGLLYVMDAATGKPKYKVDILEETYPGKKTYHLTDPFSTYDMREWKWPENSRYHGPAPFMLVPSYYHGTFGTDMSYDGNKTLFHYSAFFPIEIVASLPAIEGQSAGNARSNLPGNTTIVARDITTGQMKWKYFYPFSNQRAHMVVTNNLLFSGFTDGTLKFFDKDTGQLLSTVNLGTGVIVGPTIGADSDGNTKIFTVAGGVGIVAGNPGYGNLQTAPGTLIAVGLSERAETITTATTTTVTTTAAATTTTVTSTTTSVSVTTTTAAATTITTTIPATTTTITSTLPGGQTTTITSTIPAQTITTTIPGGVTTITSPQAGALPVEVTYAAIAIAVIAIIAAAVLAMRKR